MYNTSIFTTIYYIYIPYCYNEMFYGFSMVLQITSGAIYFQSMLRMASF